MAAILKLTCTELDFLNQMLCLLLLKPGRKHHFGMQTTYQRRPNSGTFQIFLQDWKEDWELCLR